VSKSREIMSAQAAPGPRIRYMRHAIGAGANAESSCAGADPGIAGLTAEDPSKGPR